MHDQATTQLSHHPPFSGELPLRRLHLAQPPGAAAIRHRWRGHQHLRVRPDGPHQPLATARAQVDALNAAIAQELPAQLREGLAATGFHTQVHLLQDDLVREVRPSLLLLWAIPEVVEAAVASQLPFSGSASRGVVTPEGKAPREGESVQTHYGTVVSPGYFATLGIPLLKGRGFDSRDRPDSPRVVIADERLAQIYWHQSDPIGKRLLLDGPPSANALWHTVIGVVGEIRQNDLADPSPAGAYCLPHRKSWLGFFRLVVRTAAEPRSLLGPLRRVIGRLDPEIPLFWVQTLEESLNEQLLLRRIPLQLLAFFAAVALLLAAVAIYGVLDESVRQRRREIGIRMALRSSLKAIHRLVLGHSMRLAVAGQLLGLAAALLLGGWMAGFLYQVRPRDPWVLLLVAALTALAALTASWLPTRRAARVNPVQAFECPRSPGKEKRLF